MDTLEPVQQASKDFKVNGGYGIEQVSPLYCVLFSSRIDLLKPVHQALKDFELRSGYEIEPASQQKDQVLFSSG